MSVSIVGTSCWMNDVNVDAPIMSPAAAKTVFGFSARSCLTAVARRAMPAAVPDCSMRPWKSLTVTRLMSTVWPFALPLLPGFARRGRLRGHEPADGQRDGGGTGEGADGEAPARGSGTVGV